MAKWDQSLTLLPWGLHTDSSHNPQHVSSAGWFHVEGVQVRPRLRAHVEASKVIRSGPPSHQMTPLVISTHLSSQSPAPRPSGIHRGISSRNHTLNHLPSEPTPRGEKNTSYRLEVRIVGWGGFHFRSKHIPVRGVGAHLRFERKPHEEISIPFAVVFQWLLSKADTYRVRSNI